MLHPQDNTILTAMDIHYSPALEKEMAPLYARVENVIPPVEWPFMAPYIKAINELKKEKNAIILAHNYQTPEIFHCIADVVGDSLGLAIEATKAKGDIIVQCGVHFMAETSKILSPEKTVLLPDMEAGCSLAESITGADVRALREAHPEVPIVTYVNTSAEVKAESDICCTSSNAVQIVNAMAAQSSGNQVLCIPDQYLAQNVANQTTVDVLTWKGACEVHELFTADALEQIRQDEPGVKIIAHPECLPEVINVADFSGSTAAMISWVKDNQPDRVLMVTECSMGDNIAAENPAVEFVRGCHICPHMKRITLPKILDSLVHHKTEIHIDPALIEPARRAVERMIELS